MFIEPLGCKYLPALPFDTQQNAGGKLSAVRGKKDDDGEEEKV